MNANFWTGFTKQADLMRDAAKAKGVVNRTLRWVKKAPVEKKIPVAASIDYSGTAFTKKNPVVTTHSGEVVGSKAPTPPPPKPADIHAQAAEEIASRRKALEGGSVPHSAFQEALAEGVKKKKTSTF